MVVPLERILIDFGVTGKYVFDCSRILPDDLEILECTAIVVNSQFRDKQRFDYLIEL